jgi:hypothetical protein
MLHSILAVHHSHSSVTARCAMVMSALVASHSEDVESAIRFILPLLHEDGTVVKCPTIAKRGLECLVRIGERSSASTAGIEDAVSYDYIAMRTGPRRRFNGWDC